MKKPVLLTPDQIRVIQNSVLCLETECEKAEGQFLACWHEVMEFARGVEHASLIANGHDRAAIPILEGDQPQPSLLSLPDSIELGKSYRGGAPCNPGGEHLDPDPCVERTGRRNR